MGGGEGGSGGEGGNGRVGGIGPPSRRPGGNSLGVNLNCEVVTPLSHSGTCPPPFKKNGKTFHFLKKTAHGRQFCCAVERSNGTGPPITPPNNAAQVCPPGHRRTFTVTFHKDKADNVFNEAPFNGMTPDQFVQKQRKLAEQSGGQVLQTLNIQTGIFTVSRCMPIPANDKPPVVPPTVTPVPVGTNPITPDPYDGGGRGGNIKGPSINNIVMQGRPIQDIAAGASGWCQLTFNLGIYTHDCKEIFQRTASTAKNTEGLATDCTKTKDHQIMFFALNPGGSVIERGTPIVAVRNSTGTQGSVVFATIVVVPCPSP